MIVTKVIPSPKPIRARASKACSSCHVRKVRCDVLSRGHPCTQCYESGFRCEVKERKKRRRKLTATPTNGVTVVRGTDSKPLPEHMMLHRVPFYPFIRNLTPNGRPNLSCKDTGRGILLPTTNENANAPTEEDMDFLKQKGALDLPEREILDECVTCYFNIFHPFFPIIDRTEFLKLYNESIGSSASAVSSPSLLLLHGIIFTACSFISSVSVKNMGFTSRQKARNCFHRRARYLYEFDFETDDICAIQTLLLMSHHYSSMMEQKHTWFWLYQAIGLAQGAGLHHTIQKASMPKVRLWKRIWWACIIRDRLVALGTGRPTHIRNADCSTAMIDITDLEEAGDTDEQRSIKVLFLDFSRLCWMMDDVITATASSISPDYRNSCITALSDWRRSLAQPAQYQGKASNENKTSTLYYIVTQMIYNITVIALHQCSGPTQEPSSAAQMRATDSAALCKRLMDLNLEAFCPTICVTAVLPPIIVHILTIKSNPESAIVNNHRNCFNTCMQLLERLGNIYWHAEFYHEFLRLTTGYTLASVRQPTKYGTILQGDHELRATASDNMSSHAPISQKNSAQHESLSLVNTNEELPDSSTADGAFFEDVTMLAHADQVFQQWLEGDMNWLEDYSNLYNAAL